MRLIDADELLTAFPVDDEPTLTKACVRMTIQHMPTIEPEPSDVARDIATIIENEKDMRVIAEPRKGKWMKAYGDHEAFGIRPFYRYCSVCNEVTVFPYKFCPNCGADMRGEQDAVD